MKRYGKAKRNSDQGYTLLEYCAGAAIILGVLWTALSAVGTNMSSLLNSIATWAGTQAGQVGKGGTPPTPGSGS